MKNILEIAVFNLDSALQASAAGADRIELCENRFDGGTTPSYGTLKTVIEKISIPVFPIIRAHGGDFLYSNEAFEAMRTDILLCKELGYSGIVTGILLPSGEVDSERTSKLVEVAYPMEVTFHRAFDRAKDPMQALHDVIQCGCQRILTSGQVPNAFDGRHLIKQLINKAKNDIIILPGSGVRSNNISELKEFTGAKEFHSSARKETPSKMLFINSHMQEELNTLGVDVDEIAKMKQQLD